MIESILHIYIISWLLVAYFNDGYNPVIDSTNEGEVFVLIFVTPLVLFLGMCLRFKRWLQERREGIDLW